MDEKEQEKLISIETAIKYAKVSIYALKHSANEITPKDIENEMKMYHKRYDEKMISILLKAYEQGKKKK